MLLSYFSLIVLCDNSLIRLSHNSLIVEGDNSGVVLGLNEEGSRKEKPVSRYTDICST